MKKRRILQTLKDTFRKINPWGFVAVVAVLIGLASGFWNWRLSSQLARTNFEVARLYALNNHPEFAVEAAKRAAVSGKDIPVMRRLIAEEYIKLDNFQEAEKILTEVLVANASDAQAVYLLALSRYYQHDLNAAEEKLKQSISMSPGTADHTYDLLGTIYLEQEKNDLAEEAFKKGLVLRPQSANLHNGLGVAYFQNGKTELAHEEYHKALDIEPNHPNATRNLRLLEGGQPDGQ